MLISDPSAPVKKFSKKTNEEREVEKEEKKKAKEELKKKKKQKLTEQFDELKDDPDFEEFLKLQRNIDSGKGKHIWSNDLEINEEVKNEEIASQSDDNQSEKESKNYEKSDKKADSKVPPKELHEFTVKMRGLPYKVKKRQVRDFFEPLKPLSLRIPPKVHGIAYVSFNSAKELSQAMIKHRGFMDGHRVELIKCKIDKPSNSNNEQNNKNSKSEPKWKNAEPAQEPIGESGRIYVRNLSYTTDETEFKALFEKYGPLSEFHLPIDSNTKKQKGFAFITFVFPEHAVKAFAELDKTDFQGRLLHLIPARSKPDNNKQGFVDGQNDSATSSFKKNKQKEKREQAQSVHQWNSLFISSNAIADIMSAKFKIKKSELLTNSKTKDSIAVRMALGETQIVNEMRRFLLENGVHLKAFGRDNCPRSKTVILVKNLPADTRPEEIRQLFEKFGLVLRVVLPPNGVTAIIEMQETNEAKKAFKSLAYSNFKHLPLYLEWAPNDVFRDTDLSREDIEKEIEELKALEKGSDSQEVSETNETVNESQNSETQNELQLEPEEDTTLFVKNLNFNTRDEDFGEHFRKCGPIYSAKIAFKKGSDRPLSMGYGFVQFLHQKSAQKALKQLQHSVLDGHTLELKISNRTTNA